MADRQRRGFLLILAVVVFFAAACGDGSNGAAESGDASDDVARADDDAAPDSSHWGDPPAIDYEQYWPPDQWGPFQVGVTTLYLVDDSRFEIWGMRNRVLPLEVWYPSTGKGGVPNTLPMMIGELPDWGPALLDLLYGEKVDLLWNTETDAYRNAEWAPAPRKFPVILFSHGLTAIRFQNFHLCEHLASHGFVVVAPDHYDNAIFTNIPNDAVIFFNPVSTVTAYFDRPADVNFIYEFLERAQADQSLPWADRLDLGAFGVSGHSYGALTSLMAGAINDRVDAIAPINPAWVVLPFPSDFDKPLLMVQSDNDQVVGANNPVGFGIFENAASDRKVHIELFNAGHYNATDACLLLPPWFSPSFTGCDGSMVAPAVANRIVDAYIAAFFKSTLLFDLRYEAYLRENHFPDRIQLISVWD